MKLLSKKNILSKKVCVSHTHWRLQGEAGQDFLVASPCKGGQRSTNEHYRFFQHASVFFIVFFVNLHSLHIRQNPRPLNADFSYIRRLPEEWDEAQRFLRALFPTSQIVARVEVCTPNSRKQNYSYM